MEIWIMGAGKFGRLALERLRRKWPDASFTVVDINPRDDISASVNLVRGDAASFLHENLSGAARWIVPAVPVHLALEWLLLDLGKKAERRDAPGVLFDLLPNPYPAAGGNIAFSLAGFLCPDNCPEPKGFCPETGESRARDLPDILREIEVPGCRVAVVRSFLLAPGVGGFRPRDLARLKRAAAGRGRTLVATACRCHGIAGCIETSAGAEPVG